MVKIDIIYLSKNEGGAFMQEMIAGVSLIIIGLFLAFFPEKVYTVSEKWKSKNNNNLEISSTYKMILRIVGAVLIIVGAVVAFF